MTGINQLHCCYGNSVSMATRVKHINNWFVLSHVESIFFMEVPWESATYLITIVTWLPWQPK